MNFQTYRAQGLLDTRVAESKVVVKVGAGSLGSEILDQIAYKWGKLIIIDPSALKVENIERHRLGLSYLGKNKARAMAAYLAKERGVPPKSIVAYPTTIEEVLLKIPRADLIIVSIDDQASMRAVNAWCVEHNVPAVYGGVYERGIGGDTIFIPTPNDVCYLCAAHSQHMLDITTPTTHDYGIDPRLIIQVDEKPVAVPALKKSVVAIANDVTFDVWDSLFPGGNKLAPHILYRALGDWIKVGVHVRQPGIGIAAIVKWIAANEGLMLAEQNLRLTPQDKEGWQSIEIKRGYWPRTINQWDRCPMHGTVSISDL